MASQNPFPPYERRAFLIHSALHSLAGILQRKQLPFILSGEMARLKHIGSSIPPKDVEMIIVSPSESGTLKRSIVKEDPSHFSLRSSGGLRYREKRLFTSGQRAVDVEIEFFTPECPLHQLDIVDGFRLAPYPFIILRKLKYWAHLQQTPGSEGVSAVMANDIIAMLRQIDFRRHIRPGDPFDLDLFAASPGNVAEFLSVYPQMRHVWARLGFLLALLPPQETQEPSLSSTQQSRGNNAGARHLRVSSPPSSTLDAQTSSVVDISQKMSEVRIDESAVTASSAQAPPTNATQASQKVKIKPPQVSRTQVRNMAAEAAVSALEQLGFYCAIFGSMGCRLYGNPRVPNDVDILVLLREGDITNQEDLKAALVLKAPNNFFLKDPKDATATYKVLHYRLEGRKNTKQNTSKVDILIPGTMGLPALRPHHVVWNKRGEYTLPVVPFAVLLLHKLQGWDDHRKAVEARYVKKTPVDVEDLGSLLSMRRHVEALMRARPWRNRELFSDEFMSLSRERARSFCVEFPRFAEVWRSIGILG